jgi:hypothetical protein
VTGLSLFLAAGAYAYTLKIDDMEVIFIHAETDVSNPPPRKPRLPPDFLSGATLDARIEQETAVINGEDVVREVLKEYKPAASTAEFYDLAQTWQSSERLAVSASSEVVDGATPDTSQFQHIVPSMYSGRMRKLVQVLLGYGKVRPKPTKGRTRATTRPRSRCATTTAGTARTSFTPPTMACSGSSRSA